jgi:hypothetical protein
LENCGKNNTDKQYLPHKLLPSKQCCFYATINGLLNPLKAELIPICHLLALLEAHHILHVSIIRVKEAASKSRYRA